MRAGSRFQLLQSLHCRRRNVPSRRDSRNVADQSSQATVNVELARIDLVCLVLSFVQISKTEIIAVSQNMYNM